MDLLDETIEKITENGKHPTQVKLVIYTTGRDRYEDDRKWHWCTWDDFAGLAKGLTYHRGYGKEEIDPELKIVGPDWWLERHDYDGSEWWEFKTLPFPEGGYRKPESPDDLKEVW